MKREELYARFEELDKRASQGGGPDKIEKQHASGRMTARERIDMLLDKDTFCEIDKFVNHRCTRFGMDMISLALSPYHVLVFAGKYVTITVARRCRGQIGGRAGITPL